MEAKKAMGDQGWKGSSGLRRLGMRRTLPVRLLLPGLILAVLLLRPAPASSAVVFADLRAIPGDGDVLVEWETSSETNSDGFYVQRSTQADTGYTRISNFELGQIESDTPVEYSFLDAEVQNGVTYWYRIEAVDFDGVSQFSNAISTVPGASQNQTPTVTSTATVDSAYPAPETVSPDAFFTATPGSYPGAATVPPVAATAAPTTAGTLLPTTTPLPAGTQPTTFAATPGATATLALPAGPVTATTTLIPLPTLTLIFPEAEPRAAALLVTATPEGGAGSGTSVWSTPQRLVPLVLIVVIWSILAGWFYYSQRSLNEPG